MPGRPTFFGDVFHSRFLVRIDPFQGNVSFRKTYEGWIVMNLREHYRNLLEGMSISAGRNPWGHRGRTTSTPCNVL